MVFGAIAYNSAVSNLLTNFNFRTDFDTSTYTKPCGPNSLPLRRLRSPRRWCCWEVVSAS